MFFCVSNNEKIANINLLFEEKSQLALKVDWYCVKDQVSFFSAPIKNLNHNDAWKKLHTPTEVLAAKKAEPEGFGWLCIAILANNIRTSY